MFNKLSKPNGFLGLTFSDMILALFENSSKTNLIFKEGDLTELKANASTNITLDKNYLNTATDLAIARTIMHEMIHAYLNAVRKNRYDFRDRDFQTVIIDYYNENKKEYNNSSNRIQHEFMGEFVEAMAISLQEWDMVQEEI